MHRIIRHRDQSVLRYIGTQVVFTEVPNEISLAIDITGCPHHCKGCHSPWLWSYKGKELNGKELVDLIEANKGITTVLFMGGDQNLDSLKGLFSIVRANNLKVAWYTGNERVSKSLYQYLDYLKIGPYVKNLGGLDKKTTNQRFYKIVKVDKEWTEHNWKGEEVHQTATEYNLVDLTHLFQSKDNLV